MQPLKHFIKRDKHSKSQKLDLYGKPIKYDALGNPIIQKYSPDKGDGNYRGDQGIYDPYKTS